MNSITEWVKKCTENAKAHGFLDKERTLAHDIAGVHGELSEALQSYSHEEPYMWYGEDEKPEGLGVELADAIFRIMTICGERGIDLESIMEKKYNYNIGRPWMHGKKF